MQRRHRRAPEPQKERWHDETMQGTETPTLIGLTPNGVRAHSVSVRGLTIKLTGARPPTFVSKKTRTRAAG